MNGKALLHEFDQEMAKTRKVLEAVPADRLDFTPHEKSWSMHELAAHVARIPIWARWTYAEPFFDMEGHEEPDPPTTKEGILAEFDRMLSEARAELEKLGQEELMATWEFRNGAEVVFSAPRLGVHRSMIMNHMIHHRGQLTVYIRMCDAPVPGVYGPSADDAGRGAG